MKEKLLLCVLFLVTYKCDSYGPKSPGLLGGLLSGAQSVGSGVQGILEGIAGGTLNFQGHLQVNSQHGNQYNKPQVPNNNYGGQKPQQPVETIVVIVEDSPQHNQHKYPGQQGPGQGHRPFNHYPNNYGHNGYGGHNNDRPWDQGNGYGPNHHPHHPHHHGPGFGYDPHNGNGNYHHNGHYNGNNNHGNQIPNRPVDGTNNDGGNFNQNPNGNIPTDQQNRPFDRPVNNNGGNFNQNSNGNIPIDQPNRPFDRPVNNNGGNFNQNPNGNIPKEPPQRPFDRPINDGNSDSAIPTNLPNQDELENAKRPTLDLSTKRPEEISNTYNANKNPASSTENVLSNFDKTTKKPKDDDSPLFVPLNPNQYVYGGDKIEINAPKRETNDKTESAEEDYSDSNIDPLDIRFGDKQE